MTRRPAALLSLILALGGCAEGGSRGSGISTAVLGNVVRVQTAAQSADLAGIDVAIEGTGIHGQTGAQGDFSLSGNFEGLVSLVFRMPDGNWEARIALNVPAAGRLTLNDVTIDTQTQDAYAKTQQVDFGAIITAIDCRALILTLVSSQHVAGDDDQYTLRLDTSSVQDSSGNSVPCEELRRGEQASVQGLVNPDGTFGYAAVDLQD